MPRSSNFGRPVLLCRMYGGVEVLDLPRGVMTPEQLRNTSPRCSECGSDGESERALACRYNPPFLRPSETIRGSFLLPGRASVTARLRSHASRLVRPHASAMLVVTEEDEAAVLPASRRAEGTFSIRAGYG
jgi:hypothetical protein